MRFILQAKPVLILLIIFLALLVTGYRSRHEVTELVLGRPKWTPPAITKKDRALIMPTIRKDDLKWIDDAYILDNYDMYLYWMEDAEVPANYHRPATLEGREAAAYLSYIVEHYDELPRYSIFLHSGDRQWHNDILGPESKFMLPALRMEAVDKHGFVNLRCTLDPGCPMEIFPYTPGEHMIRVGDTRARMVEIYETLFNETAPEIIGNVCCGQFAVSKEGIQRRPKTDYERMLNWLIDIDYETTFGKGWVFEKTWHIVFGKESQYCPEFEQCRCDLFGWCGPLGDGRMLEPA